MEHRLRYYAVLMYQVLVIPFRTKKRTRALHLTCFVVSVFLLFWTYTLYVNQMNNMKRIILEVIGEERDTSIKVLPGEKTTLLEPSHTCQFEGRNALAIVMVVSMAENQDRRKTIRKTWASIKYEGDIMVFFFVGRPQTTTYKDLLEEAHVYGDLIIDDFQEHYYALAIKTLRMLKWFLKNCHKSSFFIKADDDVYINLPAMSTHLKELASDPEFKFMGRVLKGRSPNVLNPLSKWYTPSEMLPPNFEPPTYIGGPCYIIQGEFSSVLFNHSMVTPLYHLEDVFLSGFVASQQLHVDLKEFPGTLDPKYPKLWYYSNKLFGLINSVTSLHTDGDVSLMEDIFFYLENNPISV